VRLAAAFPLIGGVVGEREQLQPVLERFLVSQRGGESGAQQPDHR
jgi:hypothetical protein